MSLSRSSVALVSALAAFGVLAAIPTAGPSLLQTPTGLVAWWEHHGTAAASIGLLHLVALAIAGYVVVVLVAIVAAAVLRFPTAALAMARLAPRSLRRYLAVGIVAGTLTAPTIATAREPIVVVDVGAELTTDAPIVVTDLGPATAENPVPSDNPVASADPVSTLPAPEFLVREGFQPPAAIATPDAWLVEEGDNLWAIAAAMVTALGDTSADDATVSQYWRHLIEANATSIDDPDLIFPGQVLTLPPMATAGS